MSTVVVFDASAIIAFLHEEPGGSQVEQLLLESDTQGIITSVNLSEVIQKLIYKGSSIEKAKEAMDVLGLSCLPVTKELATSAAGLYTDTRSANASLADRICLAAAIQQQALAVTTDRAWASLNIPGLRVTSLR